MTSCRSIILLLVLSVSVLLGVGCTTEVDYSMGAEFVPTNQNMELKRRVYKLGKMTEGDTMMDCPLTLTRLYHSDSLRSSNIEVGYFGREQSDTFGTRTAGFMSQMIFSLSLHKERGWGYRPIYDSMLLSLYVVDFHGDTTRPYRFEVYEITSNDYFELPKDRDTSFYISFDPEPYISDKPIFEFTYPNQDRGVYVGDMSEPKNCEVRLEETPQSAEYLSRLMLTTELDANDGFALDKDSIYVAGNERKFLDVVKGIYIKPADDMEGAMFSTDLENTALLLYSRGRYEEDPTIIRDTTYMIYNLYLDSDTYELEAGNVSINTVEHDYAGSKVDTEEYMTTCFVDGMGGIVTEVQFTDEFIESLAEIVTSAGKDAVVSVNQAMMSVYLDGSDYDYTLLSPSVVTPLLNSAMHRLGLYTDYETLIAVTDYAYTIESKSSPLAYDGYLNRSLACYQMDIATYIQSLMNAAADNVDESGKVDLKKFSADYTPESESLVAYRRFYIAPEAYSLYGFNRQAIYGMEGDVGGVKAVAPIKLELTYTVIN